MKTINKPVIEFFINAKQIKISVAPYISALTVIREQLGLKGAKEVCAEGDCGACTIALGRWEINGIFKYRAVNACILPASRLHGCHAITIEGLAEDNKLHMIQQKMLENHAVQCGYCTAGMIMSMFCLLANDNTPSRAKILASLEGNLCRCTGYKSIYSAAESSAEFLLNKTGAEIHNAIFPSYVENIKNNIKKTSSIKFENKTAEVGDICEDYNIPGTTSELFTLLARYSGDFKIINGGTDLMVQANMNGVFPRHFIDISKIKEFNFIREDQNKIVVGGNVTLNQLLESDVIHEKLPTLFKAISLMASNQIRNIATLAGNLANGSPIADSACVLLALNADIILLSQNGERKIALEDFYLDCKITAIDTAKEVLCRIEIPPESGYCSYEKSSKRSVLDISTVNSTIHMTIDKQDVISSCRIVFGGVAKCSSLAKEGMQYIVGKKISEQNVEQLASIVAKEFNPITDVRGTAEYRATLIHNHILKHFRLR